MRTTWHSTETTFTRFLLAGDIGGTNSNLALVGENDGHFTLLIECVFPSPEIKGLIEPIRQTLAEAGKRLDGIKIERCCISGAGPVENNYCKLSNLSWNIDGKEIAAAIGIPTIVINDFLAISYGVPLLDVNDPSKITQLPHSDGSLSKPSGDVSLIIGAGTGLGVGFVINHGGKMVAYPSEGGHASFANFDAETSELKHYVTRNTNFASEIELLVSGRGLANIFNFYRDVRKVTLTGILKDIDAAPDSDKPAMIGAHADNNPVCRDVLRMFIKVYGRITADFATVLLPSNGIYLAGGIVEKNDSFFADGKQFMYYFEQNFRPNIQEILKKFPVYIIREYSISLYGAANAAVLLD
ncbi:glucokinase [Cerasicoccus arenae]|uniref:Glucokinase n=1 Tax=Cerasicoccus arenae TaxID=424488 RepID=A0A8J3DHH1_9BACT|nr:glucokinase [Cerasicoccus arenae]MBK1856790.1 glucokinase [Cerasicoccus arenae]GHB99521.1 glucokinase [Cerasicoccus arenae]